MSLCRSYLRPILTGLGILFLTGSLAAQTSLQKETPADRQLADYFRSETAKLSSACLSNIDSLADWQVRRPELRRQAAEMLGLDPMPTRSLLNPVVTGRLEHDDFVVEKLYFESLPHLYVTANLYLPREVTKPLPTILYLCGHSAVVSNGVSYGNKTAYQHHGIWFARNGYACLVIDTLQWGEILGHHWGTFREGSWWWNSRGYTPAGIETWNAMRALDYLGTRREVDTNRIGVTGRSGGGAYSWFLAAVDDRVKVIAPASGITDLQNYCVDGAVDGHCDCMFLLNTYRWDYPTLTALCAPRPVLLENADADSLFPLDGVIRTRNRVKQIYDLYKASTNFGLVVVPGPHKDVQELQVAAFRWFNKYLKHEDPVISMAAVKFFTPQQLKVFDKLPEDQINTSIQDSFVPAPYSGEFVEEFRGSQISLPPAPPVPSNGQGWSALRTKWTNELRKKCFAGWPTNPALPAMRAIFSLKSNGLRYECFEFASQSNVILRMYTLRKSSLSKPREIKLFIADSNSISPESLAPNQDLPLSQFEKIVQPFSPQSLKNGEPAYAVFFPRGLGSGAWSGGSKAEWGIRRRFILLGQTVDGMRVFDITQAVRALKSEKEFRSTHLCLRGNGNAAVNALYSSLFVEGIDSLELAHLPSSHRNGSDYLNVLRYLDIPEAAAIAAERCHLYLKTIQPGDWRFLKEMSASPATHLKLDWLD